MADMTAPDTATDPCCAPEQQAACCEPNAKADCCGHGEGCGCDAAATTPASDIREAVRERYAAAATQVTTSDPGAGCCAPSETFDGGSEVFGAALYALSDQSSYPTPRPSPPSAAATPPPSPNCTRARRSSTSAQAAACDVLIFR